MTLAADIEIEAEGWRVLGSIEREAGAWMAAAGLAAGLNEDAVVSVLLCDDETIRSLNRQWRGHDKATNVLSFPAAGPRPPEGPRPLGDIAVAFETTQAEAEADRKPLQAHLAHLLVHGTLHLLGHDHEEAGAADVMEDAERRILAELGFADPYAGSEPMGATLP